MSNEHNGAHGAEHEHIHLPPPSVSPFVLSLGLAIIILGLPFHIIITLLGVVIFIAGLGMWLAQDVHTFQVQDDWQ
jgi:hypothetical protein